MARMHIVCIILIAVLVSMIGVACATPPARPDDVISSRTFGDNVTLTGTSYIGDRSGTVICGYGDIPGKGIRGYAVKCDINGYQCWARDYGPEGDNYLYKVLPVSEGICLMVGETRQAGSDRSRGLVVKIDKNGFAAFTTLYGDPLGSGGFTDAIRERDGNYLLVGTNRSASGTTCIWLVRIDADGNVKMDVTAGVNGSCRGEKIVEAEYDGYTIVGTVQPEGIPYQRAYALHVDGNGNKLWEQTYSDPGSDANAIVACVDGYMLAGHTGGSPRNLMLYRINKSGTVFRHYVIEGGVDREVAAIDHQINGWVMIGDETDAGGKTAGFIMMVDADGQPQWNRTFDGGRQTSLRGMSTFEGIFNCVGTNDGRFWIVNIGMDRDQGPSPARWCLPMLVLPAIAVGLSTRIRRRR